MSFNLNCKPLVLTHSYWCVVLRYLVLPIGHRAAKLQGLMLDGPKQQKLLIKLCFNDALVVDSLPWFMSEARKNLKVGVLNPQRGNGSNSLVAPAKPQSA